MRQWIQKIKDQRIYYSSQVSKSLKRLSRTMYHQCHTDSLRITRNQTIENFNTPKENDCDDNCRKHYEKTLNKVNFRVK